MQRTASATGIAREYKDIFEIGGVPAYRQFYEFGIFIWKYLYRGLYKDWHIISAPTIKNPNARRELFRLNTAKAVCAELASLVWGEQAEIHISTNGHTEEKNADGVVTNPDPLNAFVAEVLRRNAFSEKAQELIEQALALGGAAIKARWDARRDSKGGAVLGTEGIRLDYCMADQFIPTAWDNAKVTEGVFISRQAKGGYYYTRLEWHKWDGVTYTVRNDLYRSEIQRGAAAGQNQDILGIRVPLAEAFPWLDEETVVPVGESLFSYFRTPIANNIDDNSPLGVSIYGNALETLHAIDICYDSFVQEFRLGKKKIIVPARMLRSVADPNTGEMRRYYDPNDEVFVGMAGNDAGTDDIHEITVELRVEEHVAALNALLSVLCLQIGFSANTFSFDREGGLRTATEVVSENSKTYKTVKTVQNQIAPALEHMVRNIIDVAALYDMEWDGQSVATLRDRGYEVKITFDDGVTQDRQTNLNEGVMLVGAGVLSKFTLLTDRKYGIGLTEKEAAAELERVNQEKQNTRTIDENQVRLFGGGA
jgi:A118 family predicted phage portal protein